MENNTSFYLLKHRGSGRVIATLSSFQLDSLADHPYYYQDVWGVAKTVPPLKMTKAGREDYIIEEIN